MSCFLSCSNNYQNDAFLEDVKVSIRDVGHNLLLHNQDSTSLVKPVIKIDDSKFQLAFEKQLAINPDSLVATVKSSFQKANLPQHYIVEVLKCDDLEVAYSYKMTKNVEKGIVPCGGRKLPEACYLLNVKFTKSSNANSNNSILLYVIGFGILLLLVFALYKLKNKSLLKLSEDNYASIGGFKFYPDQNKLVKKAIEISLSKKECEILEIFVAQPNQIIKRDELTKRVWEDNGVIVGRSLDTYISKLRKKLQEDDSIKLINIHGVGYKLEIEKAN